MGTVIASKNGHYVRMTVDFWYQVDDNSIHIASPDDSRFHTTVNDRYGSARQHHNLYSKLERLLVEHTTDSVAKTVMMTRKGKI